MAKIRLGKFEVDEAELDRQHKEATKRGEKALLEEPRAVSVRYDKKQKRMVINLNSGATFIFPPRLAQGLSEAIDKELADVKILGHGFVIEWTSLDVHFSIKGLLSGIYGNKNWMNNLHQLRAENSEIKPQRKVA